MSRKRSREEVCDICDKSTNTLNDCYHCRSRVCKKDTFWCSRKECSLQICRVCQEYPSLQIKQVGKTTTWLCVEHWNGCAFCNDSTILYDCWRCPKFVCAKHCHWCSEEDCGLQVCRNCQFEENFVRTERGWFCGEHAGRDKDVGT